LLRRHGHAVRRYFAVMMLMLMLMLMLMMVKLHGMYRRVWHRGKCDVGRAEIFSLMRMYV